MGLNDGLVLANVKEAEWIDSLGYSEVSGVTGRPAERCLPMPPVEGDILLWYMLDGYRQNRSLDGTTGRDVAALPEPGDIEEFCKSCGFLLTGRTTECDGCTVAVHDYPGCLMRVQEIDAERRLVYTYFLCIPCANEWYNHNHLHLFSSQER